MPNKITFIFKDDSKHHIYEGKQTVFELLSKTDMSGLNYDFPCGGKKTCKKCRIKITDGFGFVCEPNENEKKYLTDEDIKNNIRYACMCEVFGDITVELNSSKDKIEVQTEGLKSNSAVPNKFKKITVKLTEPTLENPISDEKNLISAVNNMLEAEGIKHILHEKLPFDIITKLSGFSETEIEVILSVSYTDVKIADIRRAGECGDIYGAAVDIGTTTAAVYLYSLTTGKCVGIAAGENPQRAYGADVITRISYIIENENGLKNLQKLILSLVFKLTGDLCSENNINPMDIYSIVLTGNTVMQHAAAGLSPKKIAFSPFVATTLFDFELTKTELLNSLEIPEAEKINPGAVIYFPPAVASYVGGDITTGIIASDTDLHDSLRLFLDVGTNGEIGLGDKNSIVFCATAAGPAFEGAHIKRGMAGIKGAVNNIYLDENNQIICETIGNITPKGICGSGIIDAVALMLEIGVIDETGRILESDEEDEMPEKYRGLAVNLCEKDDESAFVFDKQNDIYITQKDVREIQLAKAAVSAGIITLLNHSGKSLSDIGELILAGGFGAHINKKNACKIGLIPIELEDKIITAGNTAGMGAAAVLIDYTSKKRIKKVADNAKYIELSGDAFFMNEYVERMMF